MKVKYLILSVIAAFFLSSAIAGDKNLSSGSKAPAIETIFGESILDDDLISGKNIVVSFWSPKDPSSRILNKKLSDIYGDSVKSDTHFISICNDEDEILMKEVLFVDNVTTGHHINVSQISPRSLKDYNMQNNTGAFLISKDGRIAELL